MQRGSLHDAARRTPWRPNSFTNLTPDVHRAAPEDGRLGPVHAYALDAACNGNYRIRSYGRDGVDRGTFVCGTTTNFNDDIVYADGTFIQWPEGTQY